MTTPELRLLLNGSAEERASIGSLFLDAGEGAEGEIDGCGGEHEDLDVFRELCHQAGNRWPELVALLAHADPGARVAGCGVIAALAQAAWHPHYSVHMGAAEFRERLVAAGERLPLHDPHAEVRVAALDALGRIDTGSPALGVLTDEAIELLGDLSPAVRAQAVRAVASRLGGDAGDLLRPLCKDDDPLVEEAIIDCLVKLGDDAVGPVLIRRARRDQLDVSSDTLRHIQHIGVPGARDVLIPLMVPETEHYARAQAAEALVETVDVDCLDALHRVLAIGDYSAFYAAMALTRLGAHARHPQLAHWIALRGQQPPATYPDNLARGDQRLVSACALVIAAADQREHAPAMMRALEAEDALPIDRSDRTNYNLMRAHLYDMAFALASLQHEPVYAWLQLQLGRGRNVCLSLGQLADPRALPELDRIVRRGPRGSGQQDAIDHGRLRRDAALAIAAIDPDRVDASVIEAAGQSWPRRELVWKTDLMFALRTLAARLAGRGEHLRGGAWRLVTALKQVIVGLEPVIDDAFASYRGRGTSRSAHEGYAFVIRDWLDEAMANLLRAQPAS